MEFNNGIPEIVLTAECVQKFKEIYDKTEKIGKEMCGVLSFEYADKDKNGIKKICKISEPIEGKSTSCVFKGSGHNEFEYHTHPSYSDFTYVPPSCIDYIGKLLYPSRNEFVIQKTGIWYIRPNRYIIKLYRNLSKENSDKLICFICIYIVVIQMFLINDFIGIKYYLKLNHSFNVNGILHVVYDIFNSSFEKYIIEALNKSIPCTIEMYNKDKPLLSCFAYFSDFAMDKNIGFENEYYPFEFADKGVRITPINMEHRTLLVDKYTNLKK